jgi:hypothetical protein
MLYFNHIHNYLDFDSTNNIAVKYLSFFIALHTLMLNGLLKSSSTPLLYPKPNHHKGCETFFVE